ncbi:MAG: LPS export ABC transporter periplasmic protein LptC [Deltaproteobacteria bacterium]|nr:LPS export ABC transporter periplasmic protein LptC [Deltaproteobacteria bacterium]MBW2667544.1 LPS export ABC transporter periplasmic protein LptC [Deltaproteobacteria bacterium]
MSPLRNWLHPVRRGPRSSRAVVALLLAVAAVSTSSAEGETELRATGMTFVGSRDDRSELILHSEIAVFFPDRDVADLEVVRAVVTDEDDGDSFHMTCERAELNVKTNDFRAEGQVRGTTADGQKYSAPWVEYHHESGLLHTSAPIQMNDDTGSFRADGFEYHVNERKFRMLGNVSVEQNQ